VLVVVQKNSVYFVAATKDGKKQVKITGIEKTSSEVSLKTDNKLQVKQTRGEAIGYRKAFATCLVLNIGIGKSILYPK